MGMILLIIWVVLMILWLFGGGFIVYNGPNANPMNFGGYVLIPWICVLILGIFVFAGYSVSAPATTHEVIGR